MKKVAAAAAAATNGSSRSQRRSLAGEHVRPTALRHAFVVGENPEERLVAGDSCEISRPRCFRYGICQENAQFKQP